MSHVKCHVVTCHLPSAICYLSPVTRVAERWDRWDRRSNKSLPAPRLTKCHLLYTIKVLGWKFVPTKLRNFWKYKILTKQRKQENYKNTQKIKILKKEVRLWHKLIYDRPTYVQSKIFTQDLLNLTQALRAALVTFWMHGATLPNYGTVWIGHFCNILIVLKIAKIIFYYFI